MAEPTVAEERDLDAAEVRELYDSVGWSAYTDDTARLLRGLAGSHLVLTARDGDGRLLGLARTLSDGETACYVQDLLVRPEAQRRGVARALMAELVRRYAHCRFLGLSTDAAGTDEAASSHAFYRAVGLVPHDEVGLAAFTRPRRPTPPGAAPARPPGRPRPAS